jgi:hypothetical protein
MGNERKTDSGSKKGLYTFVFVHVNLTVDHSVASRNEESRSTVAIYVTFPSVFRYLRCNMLEREAHN